MKSFDRLNPITVLFFYIFAIVTPMFSLNTVTALISLLGSMILCLTTNGKITKRYVFLIFLFILCVCINPLFNKNGSTALFFINDTPITYESVTYGIVSALTLVSVISWFFTFSDIMTSEKIIYIFGRISPKIAMVISMSVRFVPLFLNNYKEAENGIKCLGLYNCDTITGTLRIKMRTFSALITRATEDGIITADSMEVRGYGKKRRTSFSVLKFTPIDGIYLSIFVLLGICAFLFSDSMLFYPTVSEIPNSVINIIGYVSYSVLVIMPSIVNISEGARWKYLLSKI